MERVLFSPVGDTDPLGHDWDGPMLHIIRNYKPDRVYLFFTKEMGAREKKDNRYTRCIREMKQDCSIESIFSGIDDPSDFDAFMEEFGKAFDKIRTENRDSEILLNISSGTPQIISTLCLETVSGKHIIKPVQVKTPRRSSNREDIFDMESALRIIRESRDERMENRCCEPGIISFRKALLREQVKTLVYEYEYGAALKVLESGKELFGNFELVQKLLLHSKLRLFLQCSDALELVNNLDLQFDFDPIENEKAREFAEYHWALMIKRKKGDLSGFILMITPFITGIMKYHLESAGILGKITVDKRDGALCLKRELINLFDENLMKYLDKSFQEQYNNDFNDDSFLNNRTMYLIIKYMDENPETYGKDAKRTKLRNNLGYLVDNETKLRNKVAHQMINITEDHLNRIDRDLPKKSLKKIEIIYETVFGKSAALIYDGINRLILDNLE